MTEIHLLRALSDNYIHAIESGKAVIVVDPGEVAPVIRWAEIYSYKYRPPTHILLTHHHSDHTGGAQELARRFRAQIIGAAADRARLPDLAEAVSGGDTLVIGDETIEIIATPGHTQGHIAYHLPGAEAVFTGDTLFSLGCGRVFEGTPELMWDSLCRLRHLPPETRLYCGHEYTQANARFALSLKPGDKDLQAEAARIDALRDRGEPTLPSTIGNERRFNPFLNCASAEEFAVLRKAKDSFK